MQLSFLALLIFAILVAIFSLQNAYPVTVFFFKWHFETSFSLAILCSLLIGAVALGGFGLLHQAKNRLGRTWGRGKNTPIDPGKSNGEELDGRKSESPVSSGGEEYSPQEVEN